MTNQLVSIFIFIAICFVIYIIFRNTNTQEGFTSSKSSSSSDNDTLKPLGLSDDASTYSANIKSQVVRMQDALLISKYKSDYESAILNLDDLIDNLMLRTALSVDVSNPLEALKQLTTLSNAKTALNDVMDFIDSS
jgi:hypothetical protein